MANAPSITDSNSFVHLHLHSQYSLLDGGNRLDRLVKRVAELGMPAVAVTDHGNLFGAVEFYTRAKDAGVKPILGIEAYIAPDIDSPSDRTSRNFTGVADGGFHLVMLAENLTGWHNLLKLSSDAYINGFYFKPRMDKSTLEKHAEGIIAINGHLGSSIAHWLVKHIQTGEKAHFQRALDEAAWHKRIYGVNDKGEPRFFLELQRHEEKLQDDINPHIIKIARKLDIPLVCDNDAHFLLESDYDAHDTLCCISMGKIKTDENRLHYPRGIYVKSPAEMRALFEDIPEALDNTLKIADRCNVDLDFSESHAPVVHIAFKADKALKAKNAPAPGTTAWFKQVCAQYELLPFDATRDAKLSADDLKTQCDKALRDLCEAGLIWRYGTDGITDEIRARLDRELGILADKSISAYFLIVWDFVNYARANAIPANARGSGVGTMVGYVLGLSNACPVEYGLLFERFTDPDRSEYPDIDIDMCQDGRQDVIDYVRNKYGHVAQIITFGTLKARAAIRDVGRVHDVSLAEVDKVCKLVGDGLGTTLDKALDQEPELRKLYDNSDQHRRMIDTARRLEGMARHAGVHAAGVVLATRPLDDIVPLYQPAGTEQIVTQWDGPTCERVGLLKMDFLGLRTLSIIERAKTLIRQSFSEDRTRAAAARPDRTGQIDDPAWDPLDLERLEYDDPRVLQLFARGETAAVFQFESGGMRNLLMAMKPDRLEDLIAANALYRPGPMELIPNYNNRKNGREEVPQQHPIVEKFTNETYGIMVYQEQVMQIVHELGGIPLRQAYTLIKAISKKKEKVINANREAFLDGAEKKDLPREQSGELFDLILKFAGYGFNKSHSTGYAIVAYQTAYLKTLFPIQYMAAVLTYESVSTDKVVEYIDACRRLALPDGSRGVEVKQPDIQRSDIGFTVVYDADEPGPEARAPHHGHIRFGLSAVKGAGEKAINAIITERTKRGPYKNLHDFCERVPLDAVNKTCIEALIKCGAFDELHGQDQRAAMLEALPDAVIAGKRAAADRASGQMNFFGGPAADVTQTAQAQLPNTTAWARRETLAFEKEVLGFYVSSHPLDEHRDAIARFGTATTAEIADLAEGVEIILGGMLTRVRTTVTRAKQEKMAMLTIEDHTGPIDAVCFPKTYDLVAPLLEADEVVYLIGKVDRRREEPNIIVDKVIPADLAETRLTRTIHVELIPDSSISNGHAGDYKQTLAEIREVLRQAARRANGAAADVHLSLRDNNTTIALRLPGLRVAVDEHLTSALRGIINRCTCATGSCTLIGAPRLRASETASIHRYDPTEDTTPKLAMASSVQDGELCASIDRY
ncbi:MAG: DNA polymerase III subunit alpha [Phycisphaeraceae bacterium]